MSENVNSLFESLDEWLNDENRIVRIIVCNQCIASRYFLVLFLHVVKCENTLYPSAKGHIKMYRHRCYWLWIGLVAANLPNRYSVLC